MHLLNFLYLCLYLLIYLSSNLSIHLSIHPSIYSIHLSIHPSIHPSIFAVPLKKSNSNCLPFVCNLQLILDFLPSSTVCKMQSPWSTYFVSLAIHLFIYLFVDVVVSANVNDEAGTVYWPPDTQHHRLSFASRRNCCSGSGPPKHTTRAVKAPALSRSPVIRK